MDKWIIKSSWYVCIYLECITQHLQIKDTLIVTELERLSVTTWHFLFHLIKHRTEILAERCSEVAFTALHLLFRRLQVWKSNKSVGVKLDGSELTTPLQLLLVYITETPDYITALKANHSNFANYNTGSKMDSKDFDGSAKGIIDITVVTFLLNMYSSEIFIS